ncbi:hypothetical protein HanXRQr2_Chr07g0297691 [Helianthus annuus]|uniref:Uncharacterized protein n=1 Tax=Helianthus annuus TaxID=4232 RepID=A0A251TQV8_HELAN|nr:hypothetical protein HanXRQr2_Chr07g0297691 [Helianthus annuus]KAJ0904943.1 hypothetical protein HanPSC8_Chr07g0288201 [Helianthus annuus]
MYAKNPERQVDTPEVIPAEKVRFKGMDKFLPDGDQVLCQEPNTHFGASALNIILSKL